MNFNFDDPFASLMAEVYESDDEQNTDWYHDIAQSIDPDQGQNYEYVRQLLQDVVGVNEHDGMEEYTYFGLPAVGAAPNILEDFE